MKEGAFLCCLGGTAPAEEAAQIRHGFLRATIDALAVKGIRTVVTKTTRKIETLVAIAHFFIRPREFAAVRDLGNPSDGGNKRHCHSVGAVIVIQ